MIEEEKIEQWLAAFYNGDTTAEEENELASFFDGEPVSEKWHTDRDLFRALYDPARISLPEGFSARLEISIDKHMTESSNQPSNSKIRKLYISILSAAAVIFLCIGLFFNQGKTSSQDFIADTCTNPEEAAQAAEKALLFVSTKLNQGLLPLEKVKESVKKTNEILNGI